MSDFTTTHPWDGETEEGTIPRPGFKYPWVYVIQEAEPNVQALRPTGPVNYAWGVYSQSGRSAPRWSGLTETIEEARQAAADTVEAAELRPL